MSKLYFSKNFSIFNPSFQIYWHKVDGVFLLSLYCLLYCSYANFVFIILCISDLLFYWFYKRYAYFICLFKELTIPLFSFSAVFSFFFIDSCFYLYHFLWIYCLVLFLTFEVPFHSSILSLSSFLIYVYISLKASLLLYPRNFDMRYLYYCSALSNFEFLWLFLFWSWVLEWCVFGFWNILSHFLFE